MMVMMFFIFDGVNYGHNHGDYDAHDYGDYDGDDLYLVVGEGSSRLPLLLRRLLVRKVQLGALQI